MKWFMSYQDSDQFGQTGFGHVVYSGDEHPVVKVERWNRDKKTRAERQQTFLQKTVLLSFQPVPDDVPDVDVLGWAGTVAFNPEEKP